MPIKITKLRKPTRVGYFRRGLFTPICSVGVSADGGIMIMPVSVRDYGWTYGICRAVGDGAPHDHVTISATPKLHYHRSGRAFVTLTGSDLPRRALALPPVEEVHEAQIMSLVVTRPWELAPRQIRAGDIIIVETTWPSSTALIFSLVKSAEYASPSQFDDPGMSPIGLLPNDDSTFLIDLRFYLEESILAIRTKSVRAPEPQYLEPSITVTALPWDPTGRLAAEGSLALWSSTLRNPRAAYVGSDQLLSVKTLMTPTSERLRRTTRKSASLSPR